MARYACSDLHGNYNLYEQIKDFIKLEDIVYFLGDAGDRGHDSYKTICAILDNPQFIYIKGNHEQMLEDCISAWCLNNLYDTLQTNRDLNNAEYLLWANGGELTFYEWMNDPNKEERYEQLKKLIYADSYINTDGETIVLSHAGYTPYKNQVPPSDHQLVWDRKHMKDMWDEFNFRKVYMVHGHTPICAVTKNQDQEIYQYANGHKLDIDNCTFITNRTILLNLDTFTYKVFEDTSCK